MHYFQDLLQILTDYWAKQGCATHFGYDLEMGAGTFNPATFFRSLGPEPYSAAYLEPSRRPTDGRYGDNPNRMQHFLQFQVILKPSPLNIQELYLGSLEAMGLPLKKHDIRFVHDDWKSPTLGAWGLGWEVWIDGMEASQFTYFQQFGGMELDVIPGEITYGMERLAMYLQNVDNVYDLKWNKDLTYGEIYHQNEIEWSTYNFEKSNVNMWLTIFEMAEREALDLIDNHLPIPAYDFVMKASHAFNMLDARGVISVSERTTYINRVRSLACRVAQLFCKQRQHKGYPLLKEVKVKKDKIAYQHSSFLNSSPKDFVLEIQTEELPAAFAPIGLNSLESKLKALLHKHKLSYSGLETFVSPRRLVAYVKDLAFESAAEVVDKKGPSTEKAFDARGEMTPIGQGFSESVGLAPLTLKEILEGKNEKVRIENIKGAPYLFVTHKKESKSTHEIFHEELPELILGLDFPIKMRWSDLSTAFARPIHHIIALHGEHSIPLHVAGVSSGHQTKAHPLLSDSNVKVENAKLYFQTLKESHVIVDHNERKDLILSQLKKIEKEYNARATHVNTVLKEVVHLCESPHLIVGSFDPKYLELPKPLLELVLITHQRHFPLQGVDGQLLPYFVVTLDTKPNKTIQKGHEKAVAPRLSDGLFLYHQDLKLGLEHFYQKLKDITFQKEHGSVWDKSQRLLKHALFLDNIFHYKINTQELEQTAKWLKADLASQIVFEFPELQGTIGQIYSHEAKQPHSVSSAIYEHWLPRFEQDHLPQKPIGIIFSLADKIDNLLACFLADHLPTSSSDPFALRRQTLGIIRILIEHQLHLPMRRCLQTAQESFHYRSNKTACEDILTFMLSRIKTVLTQYDLRPDEIAAVLRPDEPELDVYDLFLRAKSLHAFKKHELFKPLLEVYKRAKGQLNINVVKKPDAKHFKTNQETNLYNYFLEIQPQFLNCLNQHLYSESFHLLATLHPYLENLFEHVKIMDEDSTLRMNRLSLLNEILKLFNKLFDFSSVKET